MGNSESFGSSTTAAETVADVDLSGRFALVTGGNAGIGRETVRALASRGAVVYLGCRSMEKYEEAAGDIAESLANAEGVIDGGETRPLVIDLASLDSIEAAAQTFLDEDVPLHILILNAGVMAFPEYQETENGFEYQAGTNHFGHFHFTALLTEKLRESAPARLVVVSSSRHKSGSTIGPETFPPSAEDYSPWTAYGLSKAANVLFSNEFHRRNYAFGVTSNALHPGVIQTGLSSRMPGWQKAVFHSSAVGLFLKSKEQGAATSTFVATSPELVGCGGRYFKDCQESSPSAFTSDIALAAWLWQHTEELIANAPRGVGAGEVDATAAEDEAAGSDGDADASGDDDGDAGGDEGGDVATEVVDEAERGS